MTQTRSELLDAIATQLEPQTGLPDDVFTFALQINPMINVDLLVMDDDHRVLLAWREDVYADGWHVPGGIIRRAERVCDRIERTARAELGVEVDGSAAPVAVAQLFGVRGHFISLVHLCRVRAAPRLGDALRPTPGDLAWFTTMPARTYPSHGFYHDLLAKLPGSRSNTRPLMYEDHFDERSGRVSPQWL